MRIPRNWDCPCTPLKGHFFTVTGAICRPLKKLNDLIPKEKQKVTEHLVASKRGERELLREHLEFKKEAARVLGIDKD